jgi:hypothetical protein
MEIPRSANDADIVAALRPEHAAPLATALGDLLDRALEESLSGPPDR